MAVKTKRERERERERETLRERDYFSTDYSGFGRVPSTSYKEPLRIAGARVFTGQKSFLSLN